MSNNKNSGFFVGIIASLIVLFLPESDGLAPEAQRAAAIFVLWEYGGQPKLFQ